MGLNDGIALDMPGHKVICHEMTGVFDCWDDFLLENYRYIHNSDLLGVSSFSLPFLFRKLIGGNVDEYCNDQPQFCMMKAVEVTMVGLIVIRSTFLIEFGDEKKHFCFHLRTELSLNPKPRNI